MKSDYRVRAEKLINKIYPSIKGNYNPANVRARIKEYNEAHNARIVVCNGAARCAIIYSDYVIKFDYGNAKSWAGGCEDEYKKYSEIIAPSKYNYLFAEITKIKVDRKNMYIMPRVKNVGHCAYCWRNLTAEEQRFIHSVTSDMHSNNYGIFNRKPKIVDYAMEP